jgi:hypothetical protein
VVAGPAGSTQFVVLYRHGVVPTIDAEQIAASADVGTAGVFEPRLGERVLNFRKGPQGGEFTDAQTGSRWNLSGAAVAGPLQGQLLVVPIRHDEQCWFALAAFVPGATLVR